MKEKITAWHINRNAIKLTLLLEKWVIKFSTDSHLFVNCELLYQFYGKNNKQQTHFLIFATKKEILKSKFIRLHIRVAITYFLSETALIKRFMASVTLNDGLPPIIFQPVKTATISYSGITIGH